MSNFNTRPREMRRLVAGLWLLWAASGLRADDLAWQTCETVALERGELKALFRDNSQSPRLLSGVDELFNRIHAPDFDAFDPESPGASAGLNFEHIISGHSSPNNSFTPRHGNYVLSRAPNSPIVRLTRSAKDDPWRMSSTLTYTMVEPHYIDVDFRCRADDSELFGKRGYAVLFFANYMGDMAEVALNFLGREGPQTDERWISANAPAGHPDYNGGGTYRSIEAPALEYDADHNFKLNLWSYADPRYTKPFYYGRAAHGMTLIMMFDRVYRPRDEIRFSLFKFKVPKSPRPALDWQYVIHRVETGQEYGFRARLAWKQFVSAQDCQAEYEHWSKQLLPSSRD